MDRPWRTKWVPVMICSASLSSAIAQSSDALPTDVNARKLCLCAPICVAGLTRTSNMTFIRTTRKRKKERKKTSPMSQNLIEDAKNCEHAKD